MDLKNNEQQSSKVTSQGRGLWGNKFEFYFASVSSAVGLGNLWRFPYQCYRNGGGAFLIPLCLMMVFLGFPLMCFDLSLGQYGRGGPVQIWRKVCPLFEGIGWVSVVCTLVVMPYYVCLMAYGIFYIVASFSHELPWATCGHQWNTEACLDSRSQQLLKRFLTQNQTHLNTSHSFPGATPVAELLNLSINLNHSIKWVSPSDEYFYQHVLSISSGINEIGSLQWYLVVSLAVAWCLILAVLSFGVRTWGKASYITGLLPYLILLIMLVHGVTLDGALDGILYFLRPDWSRLLTVQIWVDAAVQSFFSLAVGIGFMCILGSHSKFHNNFIRDALLVTSLDFLASILCGLVVFSILGHMSHNLQAPLDEVVVQGPGLSFIAYTEAVTTMPAAQFWSAIFMLMLVMLALGTVVAGAANIKTTIEISFPDILNTTGRQFAALSMICVACFLIGLLYMTQGGMYFIHMVDSYGATYSVLIIAVAASLVITWVYGMRKFLNDMKVMLGHRPSLFIPFCLVLCVPLVILFILVFLLIGFHPLQYGSYKFPAWADIFGLFLTLGQIFVIPAVAIYKLFSSSPGHSIRERLKILTRPSPLWCPPEDQDHHVKDPFLSKGTTEKEEIL